MTQTEPQLHNTAYLNSYWFDGTEPLTDDDMRARVQELKQYGIEYQLADIGILRSTKDSLNGTLPEEGYRHLARWMRITRETDPNQKIIPIVNDGNRYSWKNGRRVSNPNFGNSRYNTNLRAVADKLVNKGLPDANGTLYKADGIQLDIEGFLPNDRVLAATASYVRTVLPASAIYSIATPTDPAVWSDAYITEMAGIFNMLNPMMYDQMGWGSPVDSAQAYQQLWKATVVRYAHAIANSSGPETKLNPTMPAYERKVADDGTVYHDPSIENVANAAQGLELARQQLALDRATNPKINPNGVHGSGIFWWSAFIRPQPDPRTGYDGTSDRQAWMELWVRP
ncbi:hypothetical protein [Paenibacillus sp. HJGM_3]|uniref:hypothetical protein n=1 Tax=Paenibacillus sp. HJGM_3 TaxID=3379816 RepID=UPI00385A7036